MKIEIANQNQNIVTNRDSLRLMLDVTKKTFLGLLGSKNICLNGFDQLINPDSKVLSLGIYVGLLKKQQVNKKRNVLPIQNVK